MKEETNTPYPVGRPRSETARQAILQAALKLARQQGYFQVTIQDIAQTAGVGRQTIYRWWPSKAWLYLEAMTDQFDQAAQKAPATKVDLETYIASVFKVVRDKTGSLTVSLLLEAQHDEELYNALHQYLWKRRNLVKATIERTIQEHGGSLNVPIDIVVDMVVGAFWYRLLYQFAPLDDSVAHDITKVVYNLLKAKD